MQLRKSPGSQTTYVSSEHLAANVYTEVKRTTLQNTLPGPAQPTSTQNSACQSTQIHGGLNLKSNLRARSAAI